MPHGMAKALGLNPALDPIVRAALAGDVGGGRGNFAQNLLLIYLPQCCPACPSNLRVCVCVSTCRRGVGSRA